MENTGGVLFEGENGPQWYIAQGDRWVGPLTASDVYEKIQSQEIGWAHFVWRDGQSDWMRICDVPVFQAAVPSKPRMNVAAQKRAETLAAPKSAGAAPAASRATEAAKAARSEALQEGGSTGNAPVADEKLWFLYYNDGQFGPFSFEEVNRFLRIGKIHGRVYAWRDGMGEWEKLERLVLFDEAVAESRKVRAALTANRPGGPVVDSTGFVERRATPRVKEQRESPRRPLVAKILMADEDSAQVSVAMCRDVSVGGMQVLTDRIPGGIGTKIRLNVSPAGEGKERIRPFVAQGVIVRILEDGRGFSFRFEKLRGDARRAIEDYVTAEQEHFQSREQPGQ